MTKALEKAKQRGTIQQGYKKGISTTTIQNIKEATDEKVKQHIKELLKPMVKDKDLLEILAEQANFEKLKNRTQYKTIATGQNKEKLVTAELYNSELSKAIKDTKDVLWIGDEVNKGYNKQANRLKAKGWQNAENKADGTIARIDMQITLQI